MRQNSTRRFCPIVVGLLAMVAVSVCQAADKPSEEEKQQGFVALFDGAGLDGWKQNGNWKIVDGTLSREEKGGGITYTASKVPDDFELRFDWKVGRGSNSGVYYRPGQYEYQILDNAVHGDGKNPRTSAASLYFCLPPSHDATRPVGEWNEGRVICKGNVIQHWLNGKKVIDFDYTDPKYAWEVELLRIRGAKLDSRGANLNLQDHGDPVAYRNIRVRELKADDKLDRSSVTPAAVPEERLKYEKDFVEKGKQREQEQKAKAKK